MGVFDQAAGAVAEALKGGRIGKALAVRVVAALDQDHGRIEGRVARILEECARWLGADIDQVTAFGGAERGQVSVLARFADGSSALISVGSRGVGGPLLGIMAWGSRGTLAWEQGGETETPEAGDEGATRYQDWVRLALDKGQTVHVRDGIGAVRAPTRSGQVVAVERGQAGPALRKTAPPYGVLLVTGDETHQDYFGPTIAADPRCRVVGLTDEAGVSPRRRELNKALAQRMKIPVLPDLDEALRRPDVQIVSIAAAPSRSGPIIERAARAGKHLYLDNLVAETADQAGRIAAAVREAGVITQAWGISNSVLADRMRATIKAGNLGGLSAMHQAYCFTRAASYRFAGGAGGPAELGRPRLEQGTPHFDWLPDARRELASVGSYALMRLLSLVGRPARRVRATTGNYFFRHHQQSDVEDFGQVLLEFDGGIVATISSGLAGKAWYPSGQMDITHLFGDRACAAFDADRPRVEVWAGPASGEPSPPTVSWAIPPSLRSNDDIGRFIDGIQEGRNPEAPASRAAEALQILIAAYRSAGTGEVVDLP